MIAFMFLDRRVRAAVGGEFIGVYDSFEDAERAARAFAAGVYMTH